MSKRRTWRAKRGQPAHTGKAAIWVAVEYEVRRHQFAISVPDACELVAKDCADRLRAYGTKKSVMNIYYDIERQRRDNDEIRSLADRHLADLLTLAPPVPRPDGDALPKFMVLPITFKPSP